MTGDPGSVNRDGSRSADGRTAWWGRPGTALAAVAVLVALFTSVQLVRDRTTLDIVDPDTDPPQLAAQVDVAEVLGLAARSLWDSEIRNRHQRRGYSQQRDFEPVLPRPYRGPREDPVLPFAPPVVSILSPALSR